MFLLNQVQKQPSLDNEDVPFDCRRRRRRHSLMYSVAVQPLSKNHPELGVPARRGTTPGLSHVSLWISALQKEAYSSVYITLTQPEGWRGWPRPACCRSYWGPRITHGVMSPWSPWSTHWITWEEAHWSTHCLTSEEAPWSTHLITTHVGLVRPHRAVPSWAAWRGALAGILLHFKMLLDVYWWIM